MLLEITKVWNNKQWIIKQIVKKSEIQLITTHAWKQQNTSCCDLFIFKPEKQ